MRIIVISLLLVVMISTQALAQSQENCKVYRDEELYEKFEKIEKQVESDAIEFRKDWIKKNDGKYHLSVADYVVETMIIDSTMYKKLSIIEQNIEFPPVIYKAIDEYDRLLNKYYKLLMAELPENAAQALRVSQRAWLKFRDSYTDFQDIVFYENEYFGREGQVITYHLIRLDLYKKRVSELFDFYQGRPLHSTKYSGWLWDE